jgi:hypothetical protein
MIAQLVDVPLVGLDLDGVQFLGSAGLSVLIKANKIAAREGRHLRLVCHYKVSTGPGRDRSAGAVHFRRHRFGGFARPTLTGPMREARRWLVALFGS